MHFHTLLLDYSNLPYCSNWSPNSSSPSSSSSPALSPINSESSSNGGRSLPGLDVRGSVLRPRDPREGLVAAEKGSEDVSSCIEKKKLCEQDIEVILIVGLQQNILRQIDRLYLFKFTWIRVNFSQHHIYRNYLLLSSKFNHVPIES